MRTFKEFLTEELLLESKWNKLLYHATRANYDPKDIHPMTHFGDIHGALLRAAQAPMGSMGGYGVGHKTKIHTYEYNTPGKGVTVKDTFEEALPHDHALDIAKQLANKKIINNFAHEKIKNAGKNAHHQLTQELRERGITHLTYKNTSENKGHTSTIVFDPENLKHVHTFHDPKMVNRPGYMERMEKKGRLP